MKIYGITGGIGSGKSAACSRFEHLGIPVIDADSLGHDVILPEGSAFESVVEEFGTGILSDGYIDREKLGAVVFQDPNALKKLNSLVHPAVQLEIANRCKEYEEKGHSAVLIEAALHGEDGTLRPGMDGLILVLSPVEIRLQRLEERRGIKREEALRRMNNQTPPEEKMALAAWVLDNSKELSHLHEQIDAMVEEL